MMFPSGFLKMQTLLGVQRPVFTVTAHYCTRPEKVQPYRESNEVTHQAYRENHLLLRRWRICSLLPAECCRTKQSSEAGAADGAHFHRAGSSDLICTHRAQRLSEGFPNHVIIENRPCAGSNHLAPKRRARCARWLHATYHERDGGINIRCIRSPAYELTKDYCADLSASRLAPLHWWVQPSEPAPNCAEFIKLAHRAWPAELWFPAAAAHPRHISGEMLRTMAKDNVAHVLYKGTAIVD
jgi:hypothetical protein